MATTGGAHANHFQRNIKSSDFRNPAGKQARSSPGPQGSSTDRAASPIFEKPTGATRKSNGDARIEEGNLRKID